jgi:hypothetical protein
VSAQAGTDAVNLASSSVRLAYGGAAMPQRSDRLPHDIDPQHPDSFWAKKRSTLGAAIMFTAPGIPMMFQGQAILEDRWSTLDQTPPIDWTKETRFKGIWML